MRDELRGSVDNNECLILNIEGSPGDGTHWTCLCSKDGCCLSFDSYGFIPHKEVQIYCNGKQNYYNTFNIQESNEVICGNYCMYVLYKLGNGSLFIDVLNGI